MALAYDNSSLSALSTGVSSLSWSHTNTAGNLLVVAVHLRDGGENRTVSSVTYNGVNLTQAKTEVNQLSDTSFAKSELWYLANPAAGANTVLVTYSGNIVSWAGACAITFTGASSSPLGATNSATGESGNPSVALTTTAANSWVIDSVFDSTGSVFSAVGAGQTSRENRNGGTALDTGATSHETTTTVGSYTMDWTAVDSTEWVTVAAEFKPAGDAETAKASLPYPHLTGSPAKPALIGGLF